MVEVAEVSPILLPPLRPLCSDAGRMVQTTAGTRKLVLVPGVFDRDDPWSRAFFAAQSSKSLNVLHPRLSAAIHETGDLPRNADSAQIMAFASKVQGVNAAAFKAAMLG